MDCQHLPYCDKMFTRELWKNSHSGFWHLGSNGNWWMGRQRKVIYQRFVLWSFSTFVWICQSNLIFFLLSIFSNIMLPFRDNSVSLELKYCLQTTLSWRLFLYHLPVEVVWMVSVFRWLAQSPSCSLSLSSLPIIFSALVIQLIFLKAAPWSLVLPLPSWGTSI